MTAAQHSISLCGYTRTRHPDGSCTADIQVYIPPGQEGIWLRMLPTIYDVVSRAIPSDSA